MLRLSDLRVALLDEVRDPRHAPLFEAGCRRQPALAAYASPEAVLTRLEAKRSAALLECDRLTYALLAEQQASPAPLWCAVLTLGYFPMLAALAARLKLHNPRVSDLDELALYAFLDTMHALPAADIAGRSIRRLRQVTRRTAFRRVRDAKAMHVRQGVDADEVPDEALDPGGVACWRREEVEPTLRRLVATVPPGQRPGLELLFATVLEGEPLERYVARTRPDVPPEDRARHAAALKRTRSRALERLREEFLRLEAIRPAFAPPLSEAEAS